MRAPFVRPFFAWFFYVLAAINGILGALILLVVLFGAYQLLGGTLGMLIVIYGVTMIISLGASALGLAAIGYVIDLLAKIEWNTRPDIDEMGHVVGPAPGSGRILAGKQYFYSDKGPVRGPFGASEMLGFYRDGKLSNSAQLFVEENGQRRPVRNFSEIGL